MTLFYSTSTWSSQPQISEKTKNLWEQASQKANWRIVQLPNGYYQTEFKQDEDWADVTRRETIEGAEQAIDASVEHYSKKLEFVNGPKIVKTFE
jgi:hypothetical protein